MQIKQIISSTELETSTNTLANVLASVFVVPMIIWAIVAANNWSYDATLDELAEDWAAMFDQGTKYKLAYEVNRTYTKMCVDMEVKNEFLVEDTSK